MRKSIPRKDFSQTGGPRLAKILRRIPLRNEPHLPPDWLHTEMIERDDVLSRAEVEAGDKVLEVGCGAHAITTVPLAVRVGKAGRVVAVERERWRYFQEIISSTGLNGRIDALGCDARQLPVRSDSFDTALIVHGIRSLKDGNTITRILGEMGRVADQIFVAESLPVARTDGQAAHLEMYNLREEIFEAILGSKDDIHYPNFDTLRKLVGRAGLRIAHSEILETGLPHYLAFIPREYVEKIRDPAKRASLLSRWEIANRNIVKYGEEHPPVGVVLAEAD